MNDDEPNYLQWTAFDEVLAAIIYGTIGVVFGFFIGLMVRW